MESSVYGTCPLCEAPVVCRERRFDGNDQCASGHCYPSRMTVPPGHQKCSGCDGTGFSPIPKPSAAEKQLDP